MVPSSPRAFLSRRHPTAVGGREGVSFWKGRSVSFQLSFVCMSRPGLAIGREPTVVDGIRVVAEVCAG